MTQNRKRKAKRQIHIHKHIIIRKEVNIMEQEKKRFDWLGLIVKVLIAVVSAVTGAELGN